MNIKKIENQLRSLIPPVMYDSLMETVIKIRFQLSSYKSVLTHNKNIKNYKTGKRAFILATGPSVKNQDIKLLSGEDCFSISNFFLHEDLEKINPKLHFFAPFHPPLILENYIEWLKASDQKLPKETDIVLGYKERELVKKHNLFPTRKVYYLYLDRVKPYFPLNLEKIIPTPKTGPQMILPVLIEMGYEEIYLIGCDHTVLRDFGKTITNFYAANKDMRKNATSNEAWSNILAQLEANKQVFQLYYNYADILDKNYSSTKVINLSDDSWLDCFEKREYMSILR